MLSNWGNSSSRPILSYSSILAVSCPKIYFRRLEGLLLLPLLEEFWLLCHGFSFSTLPWDLKVELWFLSPHYKQVSLKWGQSSQPIWCFCFSIRNPEQWFLWLKKVFQLLFARFLSTHLKIKSGEYLERKSWSMQLILTDYSTDVLWCCCEHWSHFNKCWTITVKHRVSFLRISSHYIFVNWNTFCNIESFGQVLIKHIRLISF